MPHQENLILHSIKLEDNLLEIIGKSGAGDGIRTHDPNLGKVVLYP